MPTEEEIRAQMAAAANRAAEATDKELEKELAGLEKATKTDLEKLKPKITDAESYEKLMVAVAESTAKNEGIAQLATRVKALGKGVVKVAKEAAKFAKTV